MIANTNWKRLNNSSTDEASDFFSQTVLNYMYDGISSKDVTIRPNDKPWYGSEVRRHSRERDRQKTKAVITQLTDD